ncbi:MAG: class I SAM-dependent methyltransferase [Cyclobacteriaceae bacterium]
MKYLSRLKTLLWFLQKPVLYPQLLYLSYQRLYPHTKEQTRAVATQWCQENCVSAAKAIEDITGVKYVMLFEELFEPYVKEAQKVVAKVPVKMGGSGDLALLYYLSKYLEATTIVESGVAYGWSSLALLLSLKNNEEGILYSTDMPYPKMNNDDFVGCVVPQELKKKWRLIKLPDRLAFHKIEKCVTSIDICHYDSDKSYRGRHWAYPKLWALLRKGGLFISDDINDNVAFMDFAVSIDEKPIIVYNEYEQKYIGIISKSV